MLDRCGGKLIFGYRMETKKSLTPEQEALKERLYKMCLSKYNRPKPSQSLVKVEVLKPGFAGGSVDTYIEKYTSGWLSSYGMVGVGAVRKKK